MRLAMPEVSELVQHSTTDVRPLSLEVLPEGIVAPLTSLTWGAGGNPGTFDGGAYHADGSVCARSLHQKSSFINTPQPLSPTAAIPRIPGSHLYGGMLKNEHFGHFLVESLSRMWALNRVTQGIESIVFYARMHRQPVPEWALSFIELIAPNIPVTIVSETTRFESLIVPDQVAHPSNGFMYGHPLIRDAFSPLHRIEGKPFEKLYVSRTDLENSGGFLGEKWLEDVLMKEGYRVFHPQEHSLQEQVSFYNGAQSLIFAEGAALHLFALTCRPVQKVYIVQRRKNASIFEWQLCSFGLTPTVGPEAPLSYLIPERSGRNTLLARARINFSKLRDHLASCAFTLRGEWDLPTENFINEEIVEIETRIGQRLVEYSPDSLLAKQTA